MKEVRVGVVGLGRLGMRHARTLARAIPGARLAAVCSLRSVELDAAVAEFGVGERYDDFGSMIRHGGLDAVVVASSTKEHPAHLAAALDAGLHVFVEKPLGLTVEDCRPAVAAVRRRPDRVFMIGFMRRFDQSYLEAKERIERGEIGRPFLVRAYGLDPVALVAGAVAFAPSSGGIFVDMMIHDIDLARWFLGQEAIMVHALGRAFRHREFAEAGDVDNAAALVSFSGGGMGLFYVGRTAAHGYHVETEIVGTEGMIRVGGVPRRSGTAAYTSTGYSEACVAGFPERFEAAFVAELVEFVACVREGRNPSFGVEDGVKATEVAQAATKSLRETRPVHIGEAR